MERSVLLVSDGIVHPHLGARYALRKGLAAQRRYHLKRVSSLEVLLTMNLVSYRALVLYFHHQELSSAALACLDSFVKEGGGVLALHSAAASFRQQPGYFEILGGYFVNHAAVKTFQVLPTLQNDLIFGHIPAFLVRDELYRHEYNPANQVHFYAMVAQEREPVVWTRQHGQGRVCYCSLGHIAGTFHKRPVRRILQRGLEWVCHDQTL